MTKPLDVNTVDVCAQAVGQEFDKVMAHLDAGGANLVQQEELQLLADLKFDVLTHLQAVRNYAEEQNKALDEEAVALVDGQMTIDDFIK